jgi:hypothetical protein
MASGRQLAEQNLQTFSSWFATKTDDDFRAMASRGVLSRTEIAKECGFAKSALDQNPRIKRALRDAEDELRHRGVLPKLAAVAAEDRPASPVRESRSYHDMLEGERLRRLEQENASLRAENAELKRVLEKHAVLREALAMTGRLPR